MVWQVPQDFPTCSAPDLRVAKPQHKGDDGWPRHKTVRIAFISFTADAPQPQSPFPCHSALLQAMERLQLPKTNQLQKFITNYYGAPNAHIIDASIQGIITLVKLFHATRDGARSREQSHITQSALFHKAKISTKMRYSRQKYSYPCERSLRPVTGKGLHFFSICLSDWITNPSHLED